MITLVLFADYNAGANTDTLFHVGVLFTIFCIKSWKKEEEKHLRIDVEWGLIQHCLRCHDIENIERKIVQLAMRQYKNIEKKI